MNFDFHPEAGQEFEAAVAYYEECAPSLGMSFAAEVREAIQRAIIMPFAWQQVEKEIRRVLVHRFPYAVLYSAREEWLFILAVMHLRREPGYWEHRHPRAENKGVRLN